MNGMQLTLFDVIILAVIGLSALEAFTRGAVLVCAAYLVGSYLIKPDLQPDWVRQAWLIEPVRSGSLMLERALPEAYRQDGLEGGTVAEPVSGGQGYTETQRQALDKLVSPQP